MLEEYVYKDNRKLRMGYTTGSCAAGAAGAAAGMLLTGKRTDSFSLMTPKGILLQLPVEDISWTEETVSCAVRKDSGDDADVTDGILIYAAVTKTDHGMELDGGIGVGRVTKPGLEQPVGAAAINRIPRKMILQTVRNAADEAAYEGGLRVVISIPEGSGIAARTFNPRLGIEGGISVLGTSGIVEPMSESALVETIRTEMKQHAATGIENIIITPGNYGSDYIRDTLKLDLERCIKCSNFIGETIDMAFEYRLKSLLLIGHIGKLVKLGAGIMNTHSKWADGRMEVLTACALSAGAGARLSRAVLGCTTTDQALDLMEEQGILEASMKALAERIEYQLQNRACDGLRIGAVFFSNRHGLLGSTSQAASLLAKYENNR